MKRLLPDFAIIGAAKSATTTLANVLRQHPRVFCPRKEPLFFAYKAFYGQGLEAYRKLFVEAGSDQLCGDDSTDYTRFPQVTGVPARLAAANPQVRLIYLLRHPLERAYSHFVHRYTREVHPGQPFRMGFSEYVETDPMCVDSSKYALQIEQYLQHFPVDQMLILSSDEVRQDLRGCRDRAIQFLRLDPIQQKPPNLSAKERNDSSAHLEQILVDQVSLPLRNMSWVSGVARAIVPERVRVWLYRMMLNTPRGRRLKRDWTPPPLTAEERRRWLDYFEPHNRKLEALLGREFSDWRV